MLDKSAVRDVIEPILRNTLPSAAISSFAVEDDVDHDGNPIIRAIVHYGPDAPKINARALLDAVIGAMSELHRRGDDRFIHVRNLYADGEPSLDDEPKPVRRRRRA